MRAAARLLLAAGFSAALCATPLACLMPPPQADGAAPPPRGAPSSGEMPALLVAHAADAASVRRFWNIDASPARLDREEALANAWIERLDALDLTALDRAGAVDWLLLMSHLEHEQLARGATRAKYEETAPCKPFAATIIGLEEARWQLAPVEPEQAARTLDALARQIKETREALAKAHKRKPKDKDDETPADDDGAGEAEPEPEAEGAETPAPAVPSAVVARRVAREVDALREALDDWARHYEAFVPAFSWWTDTPLAEVRTQLEQYAELHRKEIAGLKGEDEDPLVGDPIGREALLVDLRGEWIAYTPEELIALGERELSWCEAELRRAAAELGHGEDWKAAIAAVKERHVPPGAQDALVVAQSREAIAFLDARDLVTIPALCRDTWRVRMIDERGQRTLPYAAYGGQDMLVAYPTAVMDLDTKLMTMRGNNEHFTRIVTPHELIPGHHLQGYQAARFNVHRRPYGTPFLTEGWALYWELRLWELGWARSPEDRIGMLFWRAHRAARILVSLRFHLGEMTPQQMIDTLVERVGHERAGATSEVRRYVGDDYGPLYQCAYMVGGLQLRALHRQLVERGGWSEREFHDAVLAQNGLPIELVRLALSDEPLRWDVNPAWRFLDE